MKKLAHISTQYQYTPLDIGELGKNPIDQFIDWLNQAIATKVSEPNAMVLATASAVGRPFSRTVLLKAVDEQGFVFYTNYESVKGRHIATNPYAALTFFWASLARQVNITGHITKIDAQASDQYFQSRPRSSQIGAWVSLQSTKISSRQVLEERVTHCKEKFKNSAIPRPPYWGGYCLQPNSIEFWQGMREDRLHDRFIYKKNKENKWFIERLYP